MKRKWDKLTKIQQIKIMFKSIDYALSDAMTDLKRRTDLIGVACQYGKSYGVRRQDFDAIKYCTIVSILYTFETYREDKLCSKINGDDK